MVTPRFFLSLLLLTITPAAVGQNAKLTSISPTGIAKDADSTPKLEHFDPKLVDKDLSPCDDFYKYSCNKWLTANPIPADQVYWSTGKIGRAHV